VSGPILGFFLWTYLESFDLIFWLRSLGRELTASLSDGGVWLAILVAMLLGMILLELGVWIAHRVAIIDPDAPPGEVLGVGLSTGLLVAAAGWATLGSFGRSAFLPVAVTLAASVALGSRRLRARSGESGVTMPATQARRVPQGPMLRAAAFGAVFIVCAGLLFGSTLAPSPRHGVQPVAYQDHAYYAVLSEGLSQAGVESLWYPSGLDKVESLPQQSWYHWGEMWLAAAVVRAGVDPIFARYYVVLPLVLLAAASLAGTLVRLLARSASRAAFLYGAGACLFFAPIPLPYGVFPGGWFGAHSPSLVYEITHYGLAASTLLLAVFVIVTLDQRALAWSTALFSGGVIASLLPVHIVVAALMAASAGLVVAGHWVRSLLRDRRLPVVPVEWRRTLLVVGVVTIATLLWATATGHGLAGPTKPGAVSAFDTTWAKSVVWTLLPAGVLFAIPVAWFMVRKETGMRAELFLGTSISVIVGAVAWGVKAGDFAQFYFFFASVVLIVPTIATAAVWVLCQRMRRGGHAILAVVIMALLAVQVVLGAAAGLERLGFHRQVGYEVSSEFLAVIDQLPTDAKLAYSCTETDGDFTFWIPRLVGITAVTGNRVVPMCFMATTGFTWEWAPQRSLYPDAAARPSSLAILKFLKDQGIGYVFADPDHPNNLLPEGQVVATAGDATVIRVP
jgi:hypothetical protein